ncbi:MAG: 2-amino-4-hydroxy-6-hydroxymethyldihydropteridine diphosphokinase, partial [Myxococcota bacterium]
MNAFIALGGNVGDVLSTFRIAVDRLASSGAMVAAMSNVYRTRAMTAAPDEIAPDYWNAVCRVTTELEPRDLLAAMQRIEQEAGRVRRRRWAPRRLDLDLLTCGDIVVDSDTLSLPHPGLASRVFVLRPFFEIGADTSVPPKGRTVAELL